jgi:pilus assembly protein CpaC
MRGVVLALLTMLFGVGARAEVPAEIVLDVGDSRVLPLDLRRAALGNGNIVSLSTPERGQLLVLGERAGTTTAQLWLRDGTRRSVRIIVREGDLDAVLVEVQRLLEGTPAVTARVAGGRVLLEGALASEQDRRRAAGIVALFPGKVLDFVGQVGWEAMVQMDVRIVEVRRDQLRQLGIRWAADAAGPEVTVSVGPGPDSASLALRTSLSSRIDLLEQKGLARTIAEPTLSCRSGGSARFIAGGEIPLPVTDGFGAMDVEYKEYGVILELRPQADPGGTISAEVDVELSQVDASVRVRDFPGFIKRRSSTAIYSRSGETIVISGLLARELSSDRQGLPRLGGIPVAGHLFGSTRRQQRQTELLVMITPRSLAAGTPGAVEAAERQQSLRDRAAELEAEAGERP